MEDQRILFTGGGTAGHVIVNLALIPKFLEKGWEVTYIGSKDGIERRLIEPIEGVTYYPISTGKLRRYMSIENFKDPFKVLAGTFQAWRIIGKNKPSVIFSKGGFVSVPVVIAAKLRAVPTIIHESDMTPGLANKISIPFAKQVLATFPETRKYLPKEKTTHVGAVVREELFNGSKERGYERTGFNPHKPILLIMGGSTGSKKINMTLRNALDDLLPIFQILHICGEGQKDPTLQRKGYVQIEYVNEGLADLFAITDYVVSRAGSNAIFEFLALRIPMLLIPLSLQASRGDQIVNAQSFAKSGYAYVLDEEKLTEGTLVENILRLQKNAPVLIDQMKSFERKETEKRIIQIIEEARK